MAKNLVVVESPAKTKTLEKYLGKKDYKVIASYGHVRDLVAKEGAVDPDNDFAMKYTLIEKNEKHVETFLKELKKADALYLATDPDREGEAISWHLYEVAKEKGALKGKTVHRIAFNAITKSAVLEAMEHPRDLAIDLVHAQQARRALDYLVGFNLSPLLWKKIRRGLSAGRVQSPALRMIVERQAEIDAFVPQEFWSLEATLREQKIDFIAKLTLYKGEKFEQFSIIEGESANKAQAYLEKAAGGHLTVAKVEKKQRKRNPAAPFITSTLQQEAARKLGFTAQRTMRTAQQLYEGVDIGNGVEGLITYMRTDSINLSPESIADIRSLIESRYGKENLPDEPRVFKSKSKNAQEAHEAIRPVSAYSVPEQVKSYLTPDQFKLYDLIWKRAVASQMIHATVNTVGVDLAIDDKNVFRATGSVIAIPGFIAVYQEGTDDEKNTEDDEKILPEMTEGQKIKLKGIEGKQHFTEPPPAFTEASLVKALEEHGIGRPSTYATIIYTLKQREYVDMDKKRFKPTDVGVVVAKFLTEYFTDYVDYDFTAKLEDHLDAVSRGEEQWVPLLHQFWTPFKKLVDYTEEHVKRSDVTQEKMDEKCPKCGKELSLRLGRRGRFVGCSGYPDCDYTRSAGEDGDQPQETIDRDCPECKEKLLIRHGRFGKFIGCSAYPKCKHIEPLEKPKDTNVRCAECSQGTMVSRKSRYGKIFYSCNRYPDCKFAVWNEPLDEPCPACGFLMMTIKTTKRKGTEKVCPIKNCGHAEPYEKPEENTDPS
jgi:DNA topoisomerase-1